MTSAILLQMTEKDLRSILADTIKEHIQKIESSPEKFQEVEFLTRKEAASLLSISLPTLSKLVKQGLITSRKLGSVIRFEKSHLEKAFNDVNNMKGRRVKC